MADTKLRNDADHCFVCGSKNPIGLKINFEYVDNKCVGEFTPGEHHIGFDGVTHGGIIFSALDDVMANWLYLQGGRGYTAKCEIRYREPLPVDSSINLICELKQKKRRLLQLHAKAIRGDTGAVVAESEGSFMIAEYGSIPE